MTDARFSPDRLDDLWDALNASPPVDEPADDDDRSAARFIRALEAGAPTMTDAQRLRIDRRIDYPSPVRLAAGQSAGSIPGGIPPGVVAPHAAIPRSPRPRRKRLEHPLLQIAATILLLLGILGAWFITRTGDSNPKTTPVGAITSPSPQEQPPIEPLLGISIPSADVARDLVVVVRRIEIAPGGQWSLQLDEANQPDSDAGLALISGQLNAKGVDGSSADYSQPGRIDVPQGGLELTNTGDSAARLVEFSMSVDNANPKEDTISDSVSVTSSELSPTYYVQPGYPATLFLWNPVGSAYWQFVTPPDMDLIYGVVDRGIYTVSGLSAYASPAAGSSSPLSSGSAISSVGGQFPSLRPSTGDDSILLIGTRQYTPEDVARIGVSSEVSFSSEQVQLSLNVMTIQPGGRYAFRNTGLVIAWGIAGRGSIAIDNAQSGSAIDPSRYTQVFGSGEFSITAQSDRPVTFMLAVVSQGAIEVIDSSQTTTTLAGAGGVSLPLGSYYLRFSLDAREGSESVTASQETALTLISSGEAKLTPLTELTLHTSNGAQTLAPFAGPVALSPGDWFIVEPGDGYQLDRTGASSQIARITLSPITQPGGTPTGIAATPEAPAEEACTIAPRSLDDYEQTLATPYADGEPIVNHRESAGGAPADPAVVAGVTATMQQVLACNRPETAYQGYSLYSSAAIRYQMSIGNLDRQSLEDAQREAAAGPGDQYPVPSELVVGDVMIFPDGRAGAWVSAGAEIAYVTFVNDGGQWLIDFWDDSQIPATPIP